MPLEDRKEWKAQLERTRRVQSSPAWPPPVSESTPRPSPVELDTEIDLPLGKVVGALFKKLAPWLAIATTVGTVLVTGAGYIFTAGKKATDVAYKSDVSAVASADFEAHRTTDKRLEQIDIRLERIVTLQEQQAKVNDEIKTDLKELRARTQQHR